MGYVAFSWVTSTTWVSGPAACCNMRTCGKVATCTSGPAKLQDVIARTVTARKMQRIRTGCLVCPDRLRLQRFRARDSAHAKQLDFGVELVGVFGEDALADGLEQAYAIGMGVF